MSKHPAPLYLAVLGEVLLMFGAALPDGLWVRMFLAAVGATTAVLAVAGYGVLLGFRTARVRIAAIGALLPLLYALHQLGLACVPIGVLVTIVALTPDRRVTIAAVAVASVLAMFDDVLGVTMFAIALMPRLVAVHAATRNAVPVMPDLRRTLTGLARSLWLRVAAGLAFGVAVLSVLFFVRESVLVFAVISLYVLAAVSLAVFAVRAVQLLPLRPTALAIGAGLVAWSAAVIGYQIVLAYRDLYLHEGSWNGEVMFFAPQLAAVAGTTLVALALADGLFLHGAIDELVALSLRYRAIMTCAMSSVGVLLELVILKGDDGGGFVMGIIFLVGAGLHLLSAGLLADAMGVVARRVPSEVLPTARAAA